MSKGSFVPLYFKGHTNEQIYSHSNQSTDATVSTNANDYVIKGEVAKPGWVQMGGGALLGDDCDSGRKVKVAEKNYVDYSVGGEGRRTTLG